MCLNAFILYIKMRVCVSECNLYEIIIMKAGMCLKALRMLLLK